MHDHDRMTGAELQTRREGCNLSRDDLGEMVGVQARTVKHWESGRAGVPDDVAQAVDQLYKLIITAAKDEARMRHGAWREAPDGVPVVLVRYRLDDDRNRLPHALQAYPVAIHGAMLRRVAALLSEKDDYERPEVRVIWFDAAEYAQWLTLEDRQDTDSNLHLWAADQVDKQAMLHRPDQPPAHAGKL